MQLDLGIRLLHSAALAVALLGVFLGIAASYQTVAANYASVPQGNLAQSFEYFFHYNDAVQLWGVSSGDLEYRETVLASTQETFLERLNAMTAPPVVRVERGNSDEPFAFSSEYMNGENINAVPSGGLVAFAVQTTGQIAVPEIIPQLNSGILATYTAGAVLVARIDSFHRSDSFFEDNGGDAALTVYLNASAGDGDRQNGWYDTSRVFSFEAFKCVYDHRTRTVRTWFLTQLTLKDEYYDYTGEDFPFVLADDWVGGAGQTPYDTCDPPDNDHRHWTLGFKKTSASEDLSAYCDGDARRPDANLPLDIVVRSQFDPYQVAVEVCECSEVFPLMEASEGDPDDPTDDDGSSFVPLFVLAVTLLLLACVLEFKYHKEVSKARALDAESRRKKTSHEIPAGFYHDQALVAFTNADANGDGVLEAHELFNVLNTLGFFQGVPPGKLDALVESEMKRANSFEKDRLISLNEFLPYFDTLMFELEQRGASSKVTILASNHRLSLNNLAKKALQSGSPKSWATMRYVFAKSNIVVRCVLVAVNDPFSRFERVWGFVMVQVLVIQITILFASLLEHASAAYRICEPQACHMVKEKFCSHAVGAAEIKMCFFALSEADHMDIGTLRDTLVDYETCTTIDSQPFEDLVPYLAIVESAIVLSFRVPFTLLWEKVSRLEQRMFCDMELGRLFLVPVSLMITVWFATMLTQCLPIDNFMYTQDGVSNGELCSGAECAPWRCEREFGIPPPPPSYFEKQPNCMCFPENFGCDYEFAAVNACVAKICYSKFYGTVIVAAVYALLYTLISDALVAFVKCTTGVFGLKHLKEDVEKHNGFVEEMWRAQRAYHPGSSMDNRDPEANYAEAKYVVAVDADADNINNVKKAAAALTVAAVDAAADRGEDAGENVVVDAATDGADAAADLGEDAVEVVADWTDHGEIGALTFAGETVASMGEYFQKK